MKIEERALWLPWAGGCLFGTAEEVDEFDVYFVGVSPGDAVRAVLDGNQPRTFYEFGGFLSGGRKGHDAVGFAVDHESGNVDAGNVVAEIFMPGGNAGKAGSG